VQRHALRRLNHQRLFVSNGEFSSHSYL
jgi:hypothetical protein